MTALVLKGTKAEIAQQLASLEGEVREAIVFVEQPSAASSEPVPATVEEFYKEMEPYMVNVGHVDYSRESIYGRPDEPTATSAQAAPSTVEEFFKEMEPHMVNVGHVDDSREAIYTRRPNE
jgi:hypothetical protein